MPTWGQYAYTREGCALVCHITGGGAYGTEDFSDLQRSELVQFSVQPVWIFQGIPDPGKITGLLFRHVSVVEKIEGDRVLVSEGGMAGYSGAENGYTVLRWRDISEMGSVSSSQPDTLLGYVYLTAADTEAPSISNIRVTDVTRDGYTVSCTVTDHTGVAWVQFPTYYPGESEHAI